MSFTFHHLKKENQPSLHQIKTYTNNSMTSNKILQFPIKTFVPKAYAYKSDFKEAPLYNWTISKTIQSLKQVSHHPPAHKACQQEKHQKNQRIFSARLSHAMCARAQGARPWSCCGRRYIRGIVSMGSMGSVEAINFQGRVLEPIIF